MKVLVLCAKGFETIEFSAFIDVMGWARNDYQCPVYVDTCGFTRTVYSTFQIPVWMDKTIDEIEVNEYDALAIPGGFEEFGFYEEAYDEKFLNLIRKFDGQKKPIAAICVAALPLGKSGVLQKRKATTYHLNGAHRQKQLAELGVEIVNERIVIDDNIITSYCPETAPDVAFELLKKLCGNEKMLLVKKAMGYIKKKVRFYENIADELLQFAVIISKSQNKLVFCKHRERNTWEIPGGHRENGETITDTAKRELYEETGALEFELKPVCVYSVAEADNADNKESFGMLFWADIKRFETELHSEIEKIAMMDELPERWTYPDIQPDLLKEAKRRGFFVSEGS